MIRFSLDHSWQAAIVSLGETAAIAIASDSIAIDNNNNSNNNNNNCINSNNESTSKN